MVRKGFGEDMIEKMRDYENSDLPKRTKLALQLTDKMFQSGQRLDSDFYAELKGYFSEEEILDLGMSMGFALGWQRFIEAFGIRPDNWTESMAPPWER